MTTETEGLTISAETRAVLFDVGLERARQSIKHPHDSTFDLAMVLLPGGPTPMSVLTEEVGEVARCLNDGEGLNRLNDELLQVAAVAVAWVEANRERLKGVPEAYRDNL